MFLNYWATKIRLLELGVPYETLDTISQTDVEALLAVKEILDNLSNEEQLKGM